MAPVTNDAAGEQRKTATFAISSGTPTLPRGLMLPALAKKASRSVTPAARASSI